MSKFALAAALLLSGLTAQARTVEIVCKPNPQATTSQFMVVATLNIDDENEIDGAVQYATRSSATAQTSEVKTVDVEGKLVVIPAGELATHAIESFQMVDESNELVRMVLNVGLKGPISSTLIIDAKNRYSSHCIDVTNN